MKSDSEKTRRITQENIGRLLKPDPTPGFTKAEVAQVNSEIADKARRRVLANESGGIPGVAVRRPSAIVRFFSLRDRTVASSK